MVSELHAYSIERVKPDISNIGRFTLDTVAFLPFGIQHRELYLGILCIETNSSFYTN